MSNRAPSRQTETDAEAWIQTEPWTAVDPRWFERLAIGTAGLGVVLGLAVLLGWAVGSAVLKSAVPGAVTMKVNTALGFAFTGSAVWVLLSRHVRFRRLAGAGLAFLVVLIGLSALAEYALGVNLGVDQLLIAETLSPGDLAPPGRMAPNTALAFVLIALALLTLDVRTAGGGPSQALALAAGTVGALGAVGYIYGAPRLYDVGPQVTNMAIHTSFGFMAVSIGVLALRPDVGLARVLGSRDAGGTLARRLIPAALGVPFLLGWLLLRLEPLGPQDTNLRMAFLATTSMLVMTGLGWWFAESLDRGARRFRALVERGFATVLVLDGKGRILYKTPQTLLGLAPGEALGKSVLEFVHDDDWHTVHRALHQLAHTPEGTVRMECRVHASHGTIRWLDVAAVNLLADPGVRGLVLHARDVTERKRTEEALLRSLNSERQARAEAEAAARSREQFVSVAAHELKTPLTGLMLASDLLETELDGARDPQQIRETTKHVTVETRRLATLVSNLLGSMPGSVTSGDRGGESVDLAGLAARVARDARASSARHEVQLLAPATLVVPGDAVCLEQALRNLVDNAVKYSPHGGVVTIELSAAGQHARIVVADQGLGVPPEQREQIFNRYHQAHSEDYVSGLGLGLAVTREIVDGHGGSLTAEFPDQGGSRFVIMLPLGAGS